MKQFAQSAFGPDGRRFAVATTPMQHDADRASRVILYDAATGAAERTLVESAEFTTGAPAFSPDGRLVLAGVYPTDEKQPNAVRVWEAATGTVVRELTAPHPGRVHIPRFTADGRFVGGDTWDRHVWLWDAATGAVAFHADAGEKVMTRAVAVSPDGATVAVAAQPVFDQPGREPDPTDLPQPWVDLYDRATGEKRERLVCPNGWLTDAAFAADGRTLFAAANGAVLVFDLR